ncbi:PREDICTED: MATE efflux family protein DTX1-like isoform X2 [Populus euphratica]|uniref:Protein DETOXIFICATION n=1 Tax=Populus euphratica TaxID=75702 RepID=A0AAJ6XSD6_POPEU|nr:PREDICTED: MATE efflux family protein DTX1-like isoform X2 [Populus euphratica]
MSPPSKFEESPIRKTSQPPPISSLTTRIWPANLMQMILQEIKTQGGRLGELQLVSGTLGFTFANVTGFSDLNGLSAAMEPLCGQAHGAKNFMLLHKTLLMVIFLLLLATLPISFLWLNVEKILIDCGQQEVVSRVAKNYLFYLFPDLIITCLLCPLKVYLSSQSVTVPIMFSSALGLAFRIPINILAKAKGLEGVSMAIWINDLMVVILLVSYVLMMENRKGGNWKEGGWLDQGVHDWLRLLKLCAPCCLTTCLEWWCWEILILLTGRLPNAKQAVGVIAIVLNFDYLLFSVMLSLATCASTRVSNELGANQAGRAHQSAYVSLGASTISGCIGALVMIGVRGVWGSVFSHDQGIIKGVKKMMLLMALIEVVNFPLAVCGGVVRGTARPWLGMYANLGGFCLLALPMAVLLAFKAALGLGGLLVGFLIGLVACLMLVVVSVVRTDWEVEAEKAQKLASCDVQEVDVEERVNHRTTETADGAEVRE